MTIKYYFGDDEFDFEIDDISDFIETLDNDDIIELANKIETKTTITDIVEAGDIIDDTLPEDIYDYISDDISDYYKDEAFEEYLDQQEYKKDPYSYNGLNRKDFD